jgi:hypothetical protein
VPLTGEIAGIPTGIGVSGPAAPGGADSRPATGHGEQGQPEERGEDDRGGEVPADGGEDGDTEVAPICWRGIISGRRDQSRR